MNPLRKIRDAYRRCLQRLVRPLVPFYFRWKYRDVDPGVCCCGTRMSEVSPYDSICAHGGCRSAKEYAITSACECFMPNKY